ncbi:MAG: asparagine synthase (glutamine-hydrolyzing) [Anaerolineales bacterium]
MCGITGIFHLNKAPADPEALAAMTNSLRHRGPDGDGLQVHEAVGFGHRRLSIIDLSANGAQPMCTDDGALWLTFNGEIYNHADLRADLIHKGYRFRSQTDTEALLLGYQEYGLDVVYRLNGMFAFGIWDAHQERLWLVRDRLGIKPLFYAQFGQTLLFGSEIKAILAHPAAQREIDTNALDLYLSLNYTPAPHTMLKGIRQLEPGQWLTAHQNDTAPRLYDYWDVDYSETTSLGEAEALRRLDDILQGAVQRRLMSDVPLGAFLSGGLDSSAVVAHMTRATAQVKTFSIGFSESSFDESPHARLVAEHLGTQHHEQIITPDLADVLPSIVWHAEDPLADSSCVPVYYLSRMTREQVTVALAGDGADEILAGYPTYQATAWARRLSWLPHGPSQALLNGLLRVWPLSDGKVSHREKFARFAAGIGLPWRYAHAVWRQIHTPAQKRAITAPGLLDATGGLFAAYDRQYARSTAHHMLDDLLYVDTRFYLPNDMIVKVDRMSMAHGLEARVPFLDHTLVEFAASLPPGFKLRNGTGKYLLRQSMLGHLPASTLKRPKAGFNIPVSAWLRGELAPLLGDTLTPTRLRQTGLWQVEAIQKMVNDHHTRRADYGHQLWGILVFMLWWQQFMEGSSPA